MILPLRSSHPTRGRRPGRRPKHRLLPPLAILLAVVSPTVTGDATARAADTPQTPWAPASGVSATAPSDRAFEEQMDRLDAELRKLAASEKGLLGELARLDEEIRARQSEAARLETQVADLQQRLEAAERRLNDLSTRAGAALARVSSRLRSLYMDGGERFYRLLLSVTGPGEMLRAVRYASAIAAADGRLVDDVRSASREIDASRAEMSARQEELSTARESEVRARTQLERARAGKQRLLDSVRRDQQIRMGALEELQRASDELSRVARGLSSGAAGPSLNFERFKGLLPWPGGGRVTRGFGRILHPRFQTVVPHDGYDIEAALGDDIRAVFEGRVAYAGWLTGYGLTLMLDHGGGYLSVYAHASALLVETGENVRQGQLVAKVGDTGSLEGPLLYFEIRRDGRPLDPALWLKRR